MKLGKKYLYQSNFRVVTFKGFGDSQRSHAVQPEAEVKEILDGKVSQNARKKFVR